MEKKRQITSMPASPGVLDGIPISPCVRSGFCCKKFTCYLGVAHGSKVSGGCDFLRGDAPGAYACGLVEDGKISKNEIYAGAGCCSPLGNVARNAVVKGLKNEL
jgi:hypothetical protein